MAATPVTLRCPNCGQLLSAAPGPPPMARYVACPHCASPVPVVPPRDPPPLFSWEVYPHLYPTLPYPRAPSPRARTATLVVLFVAAGLMLGASGYFVYGGVVVLAPHEYSLGGVVRGPGGPVPFARLNVTGEDQFREVLFAGPDGSFSLGSVPSGAVTLNVTASTYSPTVVQLFVSQVYLAVGGGGPDSIVVPMYFGDNSTTNLVADTAFPSLEALASSIWSGMVVWLFTGLLVLFATWAYMRNGRFTRGAVAGSAALASTTVPLLLGLTIIYPWTLYVALALGALGAAGLTLVLVPMAAVGRPPDYGPVD